ncbi:MAG TPA: SgcJ/EcaC family oxidoreductase [Gemmataceae bacterium]|nr:SgcJ/EcaC family oxidoreductase [Gemmataceae bacterium]
MSSRRHPLVLLGFCAAAAGWLALASGDPGNAGQPPATPAAPVAAAEPAAKEDRPADREGVKKAIEAFAAAFAKGDGKALAALWTAEGEYVSDDGETFRGRAALEKAYTEYFAKNPDNAMEIEIESIRFPSRDTAVVEGFFKLRTGKKKELVVSRCSFLLAREDGKWLIALAREHPGDGLTVRDLEWLIGTWEAKRDGTTVTTKYEWTANKTFIRCHLSIVQDGKTTTGMQIIGKMPSTGGLHIWTFEDEGGIGDADITREGKKWMFATRGSTADGRVVTATNILTPVDPDSFLWQTVERTIDDEPQPDLPPVKVTRVKGKP